MLGAAEHRRARGPGPPPRPRAAVRRRARDRPAPEARRPPEAQDHRPPRHERGPIDPDNCDALARSVGRDRRLFLVTIRIERTYRRAQNARLTQCANRHRNTRLIDWYAYSHDHPGWFYSDGYHLNGTGRVRYADLLDRRTS